MIGWVPSGRLTRRVARVDDVMVPLSASAIVGEGAPIAEVVELLAVFGFVFVVGRGKLVAFITPSDLDRHASRGHFYLLVARVEMLLARHVSQALDEATLKRHLTKAARTRYETVLRRQQEVTIVEYLDLATLMSLTRRTSTFALLDSPERERWRESMSKVKAIRNAIMHPNAPLTDRSAAKLRDAQRSALYLINNLVQIQQFPGRT